MARDYSKYSTDTLVSHIKELERQLKNEKYGLYWDKSIETERVVSDCKEKMPVLSRDSDLSLMKDDYTDFHILVEGDNFHTLVSLNMISGEKGMVDAIYIDPPYNTLRNDFMYNDKYRDPDDNFKHSMWLSFMNSRLRLSWTLLKEGGSIFISINGKEFAQLKLLCDSLFNEDNYVGTITWESTTQPTNAGKAKFGLQQKSEFILMYTKNKRECEGYSLREVIVEKNYPDEDENGKRCRHEIIEKSSKGSYNRETMKFKILGQDPRPGKRWQIGERTARELEETGRVAIVDGIVKKRVYPEDEVVDLNYEPFWSHLSADQYGTAQSGKADLGKILGHDHDFETVKPVDLIKTLLFHVVGNNPNAIVLDFFAGSGTTGQAVLELNEEDDGNRQFILCTNNDGNICSEILYPRIATVMTGTRNDGSKYGNGFPANLMYYKTDFIDDSRNTDQAKYSLAEKVDELICILENTFICCDRTNEYSHYKSADGLRNTFIYSDYYSKDVFEVFINKIKQASGDKTIYMFSVDNTIDEKLFDAVTSVTLKSFPSKIYEIYKEIVEDIKRSEQ